jgi:threonyl-tRNA synthetase
MSIDHRRLGRELDLFDSDPLIGAGLPFWLPAGAAARHEVESYLHDLERRAGYRHVYSPALGKRRMYELSGHWGNFADDMFPPMRLGDDELVLRPSLCPHHALIFRARGRSYRELPLRIAELGPMYRAERSGVVGGLSRVRQMLLNDAHIFCAEDQAGAEVAGVLALMRQVHAALGMGPVSYQLSLRGPGKKYGGDDAMWARAEALLRGALAHEGVAFTEVAGEAAFYGPKIDFKVVDAIKRLWQLSTIQVDFNLPQRFDLEYIGSDNKPHQPIMVHRAILGSFERFFGILIEHYAGAFPVWLAPTQAIVLPISDRFNDKAVEVERRLQADGHRVQADLRGEKIGAKIRDAQLKKIPFMLVIGEREAASDAVAARDRVKGDTGAVGVAEFSARLKELVRTRALQT